MAGTEASTGWRCLVCGFDDIAFDDTVAPTTRGTCICVRCYTRETKTVKAPPLRLRKEIELTLAQMQP